MGIIDDIFKGIDVDDLKGAKINVFKIGGDTNSEDPKEKEPKLNDSTRAAKLAKVRIMISVYDQIKGLSANEIGDVLTAVHEVIAHSCEMLILDEDIGRHFIKKGEKITREFLAKLEKDESAGD